jgi:hypothetical protein
MFDHLWASSWSRATDSDSLCARNEDQDLTALSMAHGLQNARVWTAHPICSCAGRHVKALIPHTVSAPHSWLMFFHRHTFPTTTLINVSTSVYNFRPVRYFIFCPSMKMVFISSISFSGVGVKLGIKSELACYTTSVTCDVLLGICDVSLHVTCYQFITHSALYEDNETWEPPQIADRRSRAAPTIIWPQEIW